MEGGQGEAPPVSQVPVETVEKPTEKPFVLLNKRLDEQEKEYGRRWVLFSDIDNTFLREDTSNESLRQTVDADQWGLVYITGRKIEDVVDLIQKDKIKVPHGVSTRVGTRLYYLKEEATTKKPQEISADDFVEDPAFIQKAKEAGFDKKVLHPTGAELITTLSQSFPTFGFMFRPVEQSDQWETVGMQENPFILSFEYEIPEGATPEQIAAFNQKLHEHRGTLLGIHSPRKLDERKQEGAEPFFYDILPFAKDAAINYISETTHITGGLISGDSPNDEAMLLAKLGDEPKKYLRASVGGSARGLTETIDSLDVTPGETSERKGSRKWRWLDVPENNKVRMYKENFTLLGPQSVDHAMQVAARAWRINRSSSSRVDFPVGS